MSELLEQKAQLFGSLLLFTRVFFKIRTGREFELSEPIGRESHYVTVCRELTKVARLQTNRLVINIPPGFAKSTLCQHFIAWTMAQYPDSQFLYISYSSELAAKHTYIIKQIMELPEYQRVFDIRIKKDSSAKDNFQTLQGGSIRAFGSSGSITGQDAGLPNLDRFSGMVLIDDAHKPDEVFSDTRREAVKMNYGNTILPRARGANVPFVYIGHRLHEDDLPAGLINGSLDGHQWKTVILPAIDGAGNALHQGLKTLHELQLLQEYQPYVFASQYQQNPQPAGGGIFKPQWFVRLEDEPPIFSTFITVDTAETDKNYNDATVFSFWGIYWIREEGVEIDMLGLHWIDCYELRVEPKDLAPEFKRFYADCLRYQNYGKKIQPKFAGIEKKSTGTTLVSVLKEMRGLNIVEIERNRGSGSKITRFLTAQPYVASGRISLPAYGKHTNMCIEHCRKITANNTHRFDDVADTLADSIQMALIDEIVPRETIYGNNTDIAVKSLMASIEQQDNIRDKAYGRSR